MIKNKFSIKICILIHIYGILKLVVWNKFNTAILKNKDLKQIVILI